MPKNMKYDDVSEQAGASKMKTNKDGGSVTAKDPSAAGKQLEKNQAKEGAPKYKGGADGHKMDEKKGAARYKGAHDYDTSKGPHDHPHGAARMGYSQSFGAARMNGYAKGAARVASIMSFGASRYMGRGAADNHIDPVDGDAVPNYDTTNTTIKPNTSPTSSSSSSSSSKPLRTREQAFQNRGSQYAHMNRAEYNVEIDKYNRDKARKAGKTSSSTSSSSSSPSSSSSTTTTNTKIGNLTPNSVALSGEEGLQNIKNKTRAEREARVLKRKADSTKAAQSYLERAGKRRGRLTSVDAIKAQQAGDRAAYVAGVNANRDMGYPRSNASIREIVKEISAKPNIED